MSALTKIFVVLLVVLSLLLSAGMIVFVNRQENYKLANATLAKQAADAKVALSLKSSEMEKLAAAKQDLGATLTGQINSLKSELATANSTIADKDGQINQLNQNLAVSNGATANGTLALTTAQAQIKALSEAKDALAATNDKKDKIVTEDSNRITDLTYQLRLRSTSMTALSRSRRLSWTRRSRNLAKSSASTTSARPATRFPPAARSTPPPASTSTALFADFKKIDGVPFATISLGSADAVTRGMKFNVIDPAHNRFLGYLTVDQVNTHDATGRLDGPGVNEVRPNVSEVKTQL